MFSAKNDSCERDETIRPISYTISPSVLQFGYARNGVLSSQSTYTATMKYMYNTIQYSTITYTSSFIHVSNCYNLND